MKCFSLRISFFLTIAIIQCSTSALAVTTAFAEYNAFNGLQTSATGELGGVAFSIQVTEAFSSNFVLNGDTSVFNNSSNFFNKTEYTPSVSGADYIVLSAFNSGGSTTASLEITFASPVTNPTLHFGGIDDMFWDLAPTTGLTGLTKLSGDSQFEVAGFLVRDITGNDMGGDAEGSVLLSGTFSSINAILHRSGPGSDGQFIQISRVIPEPLSATLFGLGSVVLMLARGPRKRRATARCP